MLSDMKLFGVALDPSDDPWSLELKRAWMANQEGNSGEEAGPLDPYDAVTGSLAEVLEGRGIHPVGKFPVPSWLQPKPEPADYPLVTTRNIGEFSDSGGFSALLGQLQDFVKKEIFPSFPVMVGIDHSATGSVISALAEKYGPENLGVIVLDQHFDALPLSVRLAETPGAEAGQLGGIPLAMSRMQAACADQYCCGNFWSYLIDEGKVLPENLSFIGVADYPDSRFLPENFPAESGSVPPHETGIHPSQSNPVETGTRSGNITVPAKTGNQDRKGEPGALENTKASRGSPYREVYLGFEKRGCGFFPLERFSGQYGDSLARFIEERTRTPLLYISLDLDVGSYNFTWAARYMDKPGISADNLMDAAERVRNTCRKKGVTLAGFDIMEFNMHFLGIEMEDGTRDSTLDVVKEYIKTLTAINDLSDGR